MTIRVATAIGFLIAVPSTMGGETDLRILRKEVIVTAAIEDVWSAWTTPEGLRFLTNESNVELRVGGPYEWFLDLEPDEQGRRGGQGARVLGYLPHEVLAFDWTFPPSIPSLRSALAKTQVVVQFDQPSPGRVRVRFAQLGWQKGEDWDAGYAYFDAAWDVVLTRLAESFRGTPRK